MRDNVSIILAAILGVILIVILPLYSVLDRQDSTSYNVVLTLTTNFMDNVRTKGFIEKKAYDEYINGLATTGNTYKVEIEAHRKILIHDINPDGSINNDSFIENTLIDNTNDILKKLESTGIESGSSKENTYLFNENDEIYIKVYNTNITSGSILYKFFAGNIEPTKVINISYGGVINKINWDLYESIEKSEYTLPEVIMGVPKNADGSSNITQSYEQGQYIGVKEIKDTDGKYIYDEEGNIQYEDIYEQVLSYSYLYDLTKIENKTITISVELKEITKLLGEDISGKTDTEFKDYINANKDRIIENYIQLNGVYADVDIVARPKSDYYQFDIVLSRVRLSTLEQILINARVIVLPGLGQSADGVESLGAETVEFILKDEEAVHSVGIYGPYRYNTVATNKLGSPLKRVYFNDNLYFIIQYTGIVIDGTKDEVIATIKKAIEDNLAIYDASHLSYDGQYAFEVEGNPTIPEGTTSADETATYYMGSATVKFKYILNEGEDSTKYASNLNYIELKTGWINTVNQGTLEQIPAFGAESNMYPIYADDIKPSVPSFLVEGTLGNDGWYTSDIKVNVIPGQDAQSGVAKTTYAVSGTTSIDETEGDFVSIYSEGTSMVTATTYDNVWNASSAEISVKMDKTAPTEPVINVTSGTAGSGGWYTTAVDLGITPGNDDSNNYQSGIDRTTYEIEGANATAGEINGTNISLTESGISKVTAHTYDKAGNRTSKILEIKIDDKAPTAPNVEVIAGTSGTNGWYTSNVELKLVAGEAVGPSQLEKTVYRISGATNIINTEFTGETTITLTDEGRSTITVETYSVAGKMSSTTFEVKIDKTAPNSPKIEIISGTFGEDDWYISDSVKVKISSDGDTGKSGVARVTYVVSSADSQVETLITSGNSIDITKDGESIVTAYVYDMAGNRESASITFKKDSTAPNPGQIIVTGDSGNDGWYISGVSISSSGESDATSGIKSVALSDTSINYDTLGKTVTLTVQDNAGNISTLAKVIKVDFTGPSEPIINLPDVTGTGIPNVSLYNYTPNISITPGTGSIEGEDIISKTTYEVTTEGGAQYIAETEGASFMVPDDGIYLITARTYDKYGKVASSSKVVWIEKDAPARPVISQINGQNITELEGQTLIGTQSTVNIGINSLEAGNIVKMKLINMDTYESVEDTYTSTGEGDTFSITLTNIGKYKITAEQTNIFGTTSDISSQICYYQYE